MAVDEAMLEAYDRDGSALMPTLRLYGWTPAALSLGRSQRDSGAYDGELLRREGIELVRRPTGGQAVLHEFERTYAVVGRLGVPPFDGGVVATYRTLAAALATSLASFGIEAQPVEPRRGAARETAPSCFERLGSWELTAGGRKLVGSAQARRRSAFLQHGSIPIRLDPDRLGAVLGAKVDGSRFIDLERAAGRPVDAAILDRAIVSGFERTFGISLRAGSLTEGEALRAAALRCWKYDSIAWTRDGRIGIRESHWGPVASR
jgi:lipoate-protein ligase A